MECDTEVAVHRDWIIDVRIVHRLDREPGTIRNLPEAKRAVVRACWKSRQPPSIDGERQGAAAVLEQKVLNVLIALHRPQTHAGLPFHRPAAVHKGKSQEGFPRGKHQTTSEALPCREPRDLLPSLQIPDGDITLSSFPDRQPLPVVRDGQ